jgi:AbrB family looped-hinge helix DNA binding protein
MTHRVGPKGQVVIPKRIRESLGIEPGDEVVVVEEDGEARVRRVPRTALRGMFKDGPSTADIEAEHRAEIERDRRRWGLP